ncbi:MAG: hypothetical protein Q7T71_18000, partial [Herbiconiux sp.]|nr:hypothetical protein [Herbiconiux sp.]
TAPAPTTATDAAAVATDAAQTPAGDLQTTGAVLPWYLIVLFTLVGLGVLAAIVVLAVRRMRGGGYGEK